VSTKNAGRAVPVTTMNYHNALSRETIYRRIKKDNEGGD
jgi:hypothetical protein